MQFYQWENFTLNNSFFQRCLLKHNRKSAPLLLLLVNQITMLHFCKKACCYLSLNLAP